MTELLLIGIPLVGLALLLAAAYALVLGRPASVARTVALPAACYALGFQLFTLGFLLLPVVTLLATGSEALLNVLAIPAVVAVVFWPGIIFVRLMLRDLGPEAWRLAISRPSRRALATGAALLMSSVMLVGAWAIVQPLHQRDRIAARESFPRPVMPTRVLTEETIGDTLYLTVLATNESPGLLILTSDRVSRYDDGTPGRITDWNGPITLARGGQRTLTMTFPITPLQHTIPLRFSGSYLDPETAGPEAERDRIVTDDLVTYARRNL